MDAGEIRRTLAGLQTAPLERAPGTIAILEATIDGAGIDYADAVAWAERNDGEPREDEDDAALGPVRWLEIPIKALEAAE
jgi:hypothetical protein